MTKALDVLLERAVLDIVHHRGIAFVTEANAPSTLADATAALHRTGYVVVDNANSDLTIWSEPSVNYAFRAWHDWHHVNLQAEFNREGEFRVHLAMLADLDAYFDRQVCSPPFLSDRQRAKLTLAAENVGQLDYWERTGAPPVNQREFAAGYLAALGVL